MADITGQMSRQPRAWWKVALRWATGCITDPHTKWSSAARMVGMLVAAALSVYVVLCPLMHEKPDPWVCSTMSGIVIAALALRAKSTQPSMIPLPMRRGDPPPIPEVPRG